MARLITLTVTDGDLKGQVFAFSGPTSCLIGRSQDCWLRLPGRDYTASRHHCLLEIDDSQPSVRDLGSLNGTFVNGQPIGQREPGASQEVARAEGPPHPLSSGDRLQAGLTVFLVGVSETIPLGVEREAGAEKDPDAAAKAAETLMAHH